MVDVFVSYASDDRQRVIPLAESLEAHGWSVWWDRQIPPGKTFDEVIEEALDESRAVIAVWTEKGVASRWVRTEAAEGASRGILVPVLLEDVRIPLAFRRIQAADLSDWEPGSEHEGFDELIAALEDMTATAAETTKPEPQDPVARALVGARARAADEDWDGVVTLLGSLDTDPAGESEFRAEADELLALARRKRDATEMYEEAEVLYADGRWPDVIGRVDRIFELDPNFAYGADLRTRAQRHIEDEREQRLTRQYERATAALESGEWIVAAARLEDLLTAAPDYRDAAELLGRANAGASTEHRYREVRAAFDQERWKETVRGMRALASDYPDFGDPDGLLERAQASLAEAQGREGEREASAAEEAADAAGIVEVNGVEETKSEPPAEPTDPPDAVDEVDRALATDESRVDASSPGEPDRGETSGLGGLLDRLSAHSRVVWAVVGVGAALVLVVVLSIAAGDDGGGTATRAPDVTAAAQTSPPQTEASDEQPGEHGTEQAVVDLSGTAVQIFTDEIGDGAFAFETALASLGDATGVDLTVSSDPDPTVLRTAVEDGAPPDIAIVFSPAEVLDYAQGGQAIALPADLVAMVQSDFLPGLLDAVSLESELYGVPMSANLSNLVWYSPMNFAENGYEIPETWDELMTLQEEMKANGIAPWGFGIESSGATGWPFARAMEAVYIGMHGPDSYGQLLRREIPFTDPRMREATLVALDLWFTEDNVLGGQTAVPATSWSDAGLCVGDGTCMMHLQGNFYGTFLEEAGYLIDGEEVGAFRMPAFAAQFANSGFGGGSYAVAFSDRPEVLETLRFLAGADYANARIQADTRTYLSPNRAHDPNLHASALDRTLAMTLLETDPFRYIVSDRLPFEVLEARWKQGTELLSNNIDVDTFLANIEAAWP